MKSVIAIALLLTIGQASAAMPPEVSVWHDDQRNVTCWLFWAYRKGGISCLPDSQLQQKDAKTAEQNGPTPATNPTPRSYEERFQL